MRDEVARRKFIPHPSSLIPLIALSALLIAANSFALDCPPAPTQWYTDKASLLDSAQADALNRKLSDFEQQSGAQFIVYVLPSLEGDAVERFTVDCAQRWGVGQKKYDNGLILFVFVKEKKIRIEVGYGLEGVITDAYSSRVIRDYIAPHFQKGDWAGGLNAAADALAAKIRGGEPPVPPLQPRGSTSSSGGGGSEGFSIFPIIILIVFLVFILPMFMRRGGGCGGCFWPMMFLGSGRGTTFGGGGWGGGGGGGWGGGGGFSGGGGSFGGGGATGGW